MDAILRLLWRYENRYCEKEILIDAIEEKRRTLYDTYRNRRFDGVGTVTAIYRLMKGFENCLNRSIRAANNAKYRPCVLDMVRANRHLLQLIFAKSVWDKVSFAKNQFNILTEIIGNLSLSQLPTSHCIGIIIAQSEALLENGNFQEADFIAEISARQIAILFEQHENDSLAQNLLSNIDKLINTLSHCIIAMPWEIHNPPPLPILSALKALIAEKYLSLAERLLDEYDLSLSHKLMFWHELDRQLGCLNSKAIIDIQAILNRTGCFNELNWSAATARLLQNNLAKSQN